MTLAVKGLTVRVASLADVTYLDWLQGRNRWAVGWLPRGAQVAYVSGGKGLVAEVEGERVGVLLWRESWHPWVAKDERGVQVVQVVVEEGARRRLNASVLVEGLERLSGGGGAKWMRCWCARDLEAMEFWRALGWTMDGERELRVATKVRRTHAHWTRALT